MRVADKRQANLDRSVLIAGWEYALDEYAKTGTVSQETVDILPPHIQARVSHLLGSDSPQ